jgi:type I restriction enzyme, S subunit
MELKAGYKRTELGVIPVEWKVAKIKEMSSITTGKRNTQDRIEDGVYPFFVRSSTVERINSYSFDGEAVLTAGDGVGTGKVFHYINGKFDLHQRVYKISDFCSALDGYFFFLFFSNYFFDRIMSMTAKSSVDSVRREMIADMQIPLPSIDEQNTIKSALSDVDALIAALDRLIAKKRDIKQAVMQELLTGKRRLPGFCGNWEVKHVGEFTDCTAGGTPSTRVSDYWGGDIRWMNSGELNLKMVAEVEGRITNEGLRNSSTKIIPANCVLIGLAGQGKTRGTVAMNLVPLCTNQSIAAIFPNPTFVSEYLYYNLDARYDELRELSAGDGGRGGLNLTIIRSLIVPFPSVAEQNAIASILTNMDTEIAALEARRVKTRTLKQGMMQELLTGRIRLV